MSQSILKLEASAGSGKTHRLTQEFLQRLYLLHADLTRRHVPLQEMARHFGAVLAITFTRKAAGEMKSRILQRLKAFARRPAEDAAGEDDFLRELSAVTGLSGTAIIGASGRLLEILLAGYDDFNVKTIDSLMSDMIQVLSPDLGLAPDFEIAVEMGAELSAAICAFLAEAAEARWPELVEFLQDLRYSEGLRTWNVDRKMTDHLQHLFHLSLRHHHPREAPDTLGLRREAEHALREFKAALGRLLVVMSAEPRREDGRCEYLNGQRVRGEKLAVFRRLVESTQPVDDLTDVIKGSFFGGAAADALLVKAAPAGYRREFGERHREAGEALSRCIGVWSRFRLAHMTRFFHDFLDYWRERPHPLFVGEFSRMLFARLQEWDTAAFPYLYLKLSDRFRHFLFDEFQDTSRLQFQALTPMIDEVLSSQENASLFIVGDRKQAIYRWRGGSAELMEEEELRREIPAADHLSPAPFSRTLDTNWRSAGVVVDFNNRFWDPEALQALSTVPELQQAMAANFAAARQQLPPTRSDDRSGYVEITLTVTGEGNGEEEEDAAPILGRILDCLQRARLHGCRFADIAVLARKNDEIRRIIRHLSENGIPCVSDASLALASCPAVGEIVAFFRFLDYPPDNLSFYTFIRGQVFRAAAVPRFAAEYERFSDDLLLAVNGVKPYYVLFREQCPQCWEKLLAPFFRAAGFLPPYDLFSDFTTVFALYERFPDAGAFFLSLADWLHQLEHRKVTSVAAFLAEWDKAGGENTPAVELPAQADAVRVITMHQAKGLEFPVVIVPLGAGRRPVENPIRLIDGELVYLTKEYAAVNPTLRQALLQEIRRDTLDMLNLLYVAFTRPRRILFVPMVVPPSRLKRRRSEEETAQRFSDFSEVLLRHPLLPFQDDPPGREWRSGELAPLVSPPLPEAPPLPLGSKCLLTRQWQRRYLVFATPGRSGADRESAETGERIHRLLQHCPSFSAPEEVESWVEREAAAAGLTHAQGRSLAEALRHLAVWPFFHTADAVHTERDILAAAGDGFVHVRPDRLLIGAEEARLVEFKTGAPLPAHQEQVRGYIRALRPLLAGKKLRAFLVYLDPVGVVEVPC